MKVLVLGLILGTTSLWASKDTNVDPLALKQYKVVMPSKSKIWFAEFDKDNDFAKVVPVTDRAAIFLGSLKMDTWYECLFISYDSSSGGMFGGKVRLSGAVFCSRCKKLYRSEDFRRRTSA